MPDEEHDDFRVGDPEAEEIERLIRMVESSRLDELIVEEAGLRILIRGESYARRRGRAPAAETDETEEDAADAVLGGGYRTTEGGRSTRTGPPRIPVQSPMVGVFYRSSGPDTQPYVDVGDPVEVGQIIGLIEAMKVFSEVPSEVAGTVAEILAHNGQLVRPGEPLMFLV